MQIIGIILILLVIGLFLLWLKFTKGQKGVTASKTAQGKQVFDILVKGVYSQSVIRVKVGQQVQINFRREEDVDCSKYVNFPDFKIRQYLEENKTTAVEFTPTKPGEFGFNCDMNMYQGKLIVE